MVRKIVPLVVVLALIGGVAAVVHWWQLGQLPSALTEVSTELEPWAATPDLHVDTGRLATLRTQLQQVWSTLDDGRGGHFFVDSKVGNDKVPISKEMRTTHWQILETLRPAPLVYPSDQRPQLDAKTPSPQQVADVFKRIADRAVLAGEWQIALQYVEAALLLRATITPQLRLLEITSHARQVERLVRRLKDVALGHANSQSRCIELTHSVPRFLGDPQRALWNEYSAYLTTPAPNGIFAQRRREQYEQVFSLWLRTLGNWDPTADSKNPQLESLAQFLPDPKSVERYQTAWIEYHQETLRIDGLVNTIRGT